MRRGLAHAACSFRIGGFAIPRRYVSPGIYSCESFAVTVIARHDLLRSPVRYGRRRDRPHGHVGVRYTPSGARTHAKETRMNRKLATIAGAAVTALGLVAAVAIPAATALAEPRAVAAPDPDGAPAAIVGAMQRDFGISADQARTRLSNEAKAARTEARLRKQLGSAFGGAYLNADATVFTVAVTTEAAAAEVRRAGATPRIVSRSEKSLDALKSRLDANGAAAADAVAGWYVDPVSNSVVVVSGTTAAAQAFVAASGVQASAVRIQVAAERPRTLIDVVGGRA